ncbi:MAG: hypothetical protein ACHQRM_11860 [Bacteroidia bacterium]
MLKKILTLSSFLITGCVFSQGYSKPNGIRFPNGVYYAPCASFEITRPLRELAAENQVAVPDIFDKKEADAPRKPNHINTDRSAMVPDPVVQSTMGTANLSAPGINFTGQSGSGYPLDPTGEAGLTAYVQAVNTYYRAYNKTTGAPLMGSLLLSNLWPGKGDDGDPIVLYDKYADRWMITQFHITGTGNAALLIAISTTNDPTGTFYKYTFTPDASDSPDYPKYSIWPDGYYQTSNWTNGQKVTIYDRTKMLAGNPAAGMIVLPIPAMKTGGGFFTPILADADGPLAPSGTPMSMFYFEDNNWSSAYTDQIHIFKITANWTTPASSTIVEDVAGGSPLPVASFNSTWSNYMNEISQKSSSQGLDAIQGIFMYRAQYRRWSGYNTLLLNNAVNTGSGLAGIRWYELRQNPSTNVWSVYQQATYAPADGQNRWMGSIAMDNNGAIGLCFALSGTNNYPSLVYTGRNATDPLGQMTYAEVIAKAGLGAQGGSINRWGDYSQTSLDPNGVTFWHTGMWANSSGGEQTQIFNFAINGSAGIEEHSVAQPQYTAYSDTPGTLLVKGSELASNEELMVDLFDVEGKTILNTRVKPSANAFETSLATTGLAKGAYLVRIGNVNFQKVIKVVMP